MTRIPSPWIPDTRVCPVSGCLNAKYPGSGQLGRKEQQHLNTHVSSRRNQTRWRDSASGSLLPSPSRVEPYGSHAARRCCVEENPSNGSRSHLCLWRPVAFCCCCFLLSWVCLFVYNHTLSSFKAVFCFFWLAHFVNSQFVYELSPSLDILFITAVITIITPDWAVFKLEWHWVISWGWMIPMRKYDKAFISRLPHHHLHLQHSI